MHDYDFFRRLCQLKLHNTIVCVYLDGLLDTDDAHFDDIYAIW